MVYGHNTAVNYNRRGCDNIEHRSTIKRETAWHKGRVRASLPAVPGLNLSAGKNQTLLSQLQGPLKVPHVSRCITMNEVKRFYRSFLLKHTVGSNSCIAGNPYSISEQSKTFFVNYSYLSLLGLQASQLRHISSFFIPFISLLIQTN